MSESNRLSAAEAVARLSSGTLTAEQLTRDHLDRIEARASVKAWTYLDPDHALEQARSADRAGRPGLLAGLPVGVKDVIDTYDMPTQHGSPIYRGNRPFADAACVALTRMAGGTILGKTVTTEFANRFPGATVNPRNPAHTPGGSSSGSAAGVADFQVPVGFGTQTGGSTIRPAAFCGVIGYKPSFGEFSRVGIKLQCQNLDTLGLICRSLDDIALMRAVLVEMPHRKLDRSAGAPRIGLCRTPAWDNADAPTQALIEATASRLAAAGARVSEVEFAAPFRDIAAHHRAVFNREAAVNYAYEYEHHNAQVSAVLKDTVLTPGRELPIADYVAALETAEAFRAHLDDIFGDVDVLLTPSAAGEAPESHGSTGNPAFNSIWTLGWTPCVTLPAGTGPKGLPLGVQLVGQRFADEKLLAAAAWVEARLGQRNGFSTTPAFAGVVRTKEEKMIYELRVYHCVPGRLPDLIRRFDTITLKLWEKHAIHQAGFWTTLVGGSSMDLTYFLKWESLAEREAKMAKFGADPEWLAPRAETEKNGPIVATNSNQILVPDLVLVGEVTGSGDAMIYELRIYHTVPGKLPALLKRFEDVALKIWAKHGIQQAGFWTTLVGESNTDLTYMLKWESLAEREKSGMRSRPTRNGSPRSAPRAWRTDRSSPVSRTPSSCRPRSHR